MITPAAAGAAEVPEISESRVFELMREGSNAAVFRIVQESGEQNDKIRRLAEATHQIETPFFTSYFTA